MKFYKEDYLLKSERVTSNVGRLFIEIIVADGSPLAIVINLQTSFVE